MSRKDYRRKRCFFNTCSIGMFGEYIYAFEQLTGSCDVPEYHQITKDEYETADCWIMYGEKAGRDKGEYSIR